MDDILTDTGWFAGILGYVLLIFVVPVIVLLLVIDFVLYKRRKKINNAGRGLRVPIRRTAPFFEIMYKNGWERYRRSF